MTQANQERLRRLGRGETIVSLCQSEGWSREQFDIWWQTECRRRVPSLEGSRPLGVKARVVRESRGVPHVFAQSDHDLFFAFGYVAAQDRLFQLDFLRRKACGRLAEILGNDGVESDVLYRTLDLAGVADREWETLDRDVREFLDAYTRGINAVIDESRGKLPIEFSLLDYEPEPWRATDSLAILGDFRWYLTGRFPVIGIPELAKRTLGDGPLLRDFLEGEIDDESILQPGDYAPGPRREDSSGGGGEAGGSNNWVLAGPRTTTGKPLVASDPHIPYAAVSIWHEVRLRGEQFNVAGVALAGTPAVMIGRSAQVAWGITNNICSQRDLFQEKTDDAHPGCFLYGGKWEPARSREVKIAVRDAAAVTKTIVSSRNGPIVNEVLPRELRELGPVSLRWLGFEPCGWLTAMVNMNRATSAATFREAMKPWRVPTFNVVYADTQGQIGMQTSGRLPIRKHAERGFRPGWDPEHTWQGTLEFEAMPHLANPGRGYIATANNRVAADDYPQPLSGTFSGGHRARRIRIALEAKPRWSLDDCRGLQMDVHSGRAELALGALLDVLGSDTDVRILAAASQLKAWNGRSDANAVGACLFNVFFANWQRRVLRERFAESAASFATATTGGLAFRLLQGDKLGWFKTSRTTAIREAFVEMLDDLTKRLGPDVASWKWGRIHTMTQKHFLSGRGDLGALLDRSGLPTAGDSITVCAGTQDAQHTSYLGAGFRMVADLADRGKGLWCIEVAGASGHPGSPHYGDPLLPWNDGKLYYLPLEGKIEGRELNLEK